MEQERHHRRHPGGQRVGISKPHRAKYCTTGHRQNPRFARSDDKFGKSAIKKRGLRDSLRVRFARQAQHRPWLALIHPPAVSPTCALIDLVDWPVIEAEVELVELLGAENLLTLKLGEHELKARLAPDVRPPIGTRLPIALDPSHFHLFDQSSGAVIAQ